MRIFVLTILALLTLLNSACTSTLPSLKPYKLDIQQGNVVTYKMVQQLRPGMTKSQVRFVMGTPILQDTFHDNRWDYFYQFKRDGKVQDQRRVILEFKDDQLVAVKGDKVGEEVVDPVSKTKSDLIAPRSKQSLSERLQFWKSDDTLKSGANTTAATPSTNTVNASTKEKSWTEKLKFWKSDEASTPAAVAVAKTESEKSEAVKAASEEPVSETNTKSIVAVNSGDASPVEKSSSASTKSMLAVSPLESATSSAESAPDSRAPNVEAKSDAPLAKEAEANPEMQTKAETPMASSGSVSQESQTTSSEVASSQSMRPYTKAAEPADEMPLPLDDKPIEMVLMSERFIATPASRMPPKEFTPVVGVPVKLQLDHQLRPEFLPNPATDAATEGPADAGPGYFERLLEKIGF